MAQDAAWPVSGQNSAQPSDAMSHIHGPRFLSGSGYDMHAGVDFDGPVGTPLHSVISGRVVAINPFGFSYQFSTDGGLTPGPIPGGASEDHKGNQIIISDENPDPSKRRWLIYNHMDGIAVNEGDVIRAGEVVGTVGETGANRPHLHLTYLVGRERPENKWSNERFARNPLELLTVGPPRGMKASFGSRTIVNETDTPNDFSVDVGDGDNVTGNAVEVTLPTQNSTVDRVIVSGQGQSRTLDYTTDIVAAYSPGDRDLQFHKGLMIGATAPVGNGDERTYTVIFMPRGYDRTAEQQGDGSTRAVSYTAFTPDRVRMLDFGDVTVYDGLGRANLLGPDTRYVVNFERTLGLNGFDQSIASIEGSGIVDLDSATLTLNHGGTRVFSGQIVGDGGALVKNGVGTLVLAGDNSYTGGTTVNAGALGVDGVVRGGVLVRNGGTLSGNGELIPGAGNRVDMQGRGTVSPGGAGNRGTLRIAGNYRHGANAIYLVNASSGGAADRLLVDGVATLQGGTVEVLGVGDFALDRSFTILEAQGGVTGAFDGVSANLPFLTLDLTHTANTVELTLSRNTSTPNPFTAAGATVNQRAVAGAVDANAGNPNFAPVLNSLLTLSEEEARAAYVALGGFHVATGQQLIATQLTGSFENAVRGRLRQNRGFAPAGAPASAGYAQRSLSPSGAGAGLGGLLPNRDGLAEFLASAPLSPNARPAPAPGAADGYAHLSAAQALALRQRKRERPAIWAISSYTASEIERDRGLDFPGMNAGVATVQAGYDRPVSENVTLGVSAALGKADADYLADGIDMQAYSAQLGVYASYETQDWYLDGVLSYGRMDYETTRRIAFSGVNRVAEADFAGDLLAARAEAGVTVYDSPETGVAVQPFLAAQSQTLWVESYRETGAGAFDLAYEDRESTSLSSILGARVALDPGIKRTDLTLHGEASWQHRWRRHDDESVATFAAVPGGAAFTTRAVEQEKDVFAVGGAAVFTPHAAIDIHANISAQASPDLDQKAVSLWLGAQSRF